MIREGLKLLEERGLVRVEQGRGTTVQPRTAWNMLDPVVIRIALAYDSDMSLLDNLVIVRRVLEQEMARAAAARLTEDELALLAENLEQMATAYDDYDRFRAFDLAFHTIVMGASGNEVGLTIVRTIHAHGGITPLLSSGSSRAALKRDDRGPSRDLRGAARPRRRSCRRADLGTYRLRVGRAEGRRHIGA